MTNIEILVIAVALAITVGVIWWTLDDFPPKPRERKSRKPYLCKCGETNPEEFYGTSKSKCKKCTKRDRREKYKQRKECDVK